MILLSMGNPFFTVQFSHILILFFLNMYFGNLFLLKIFHKNLKKHHIDEYNEYKAIYALDITNNSFFTPSRQSFNERFAIIFRLLKFPFNFDEKDSINMKKLKKYLKHKYILISVGFIETIFLMLMLEV